MTRHRPDWGSGETFFGPRHTYREELLLNRLPEGGGRLLDAACGLGTFSAKAKAKGWWVVGLDGDPGAAIRTLKRGIPAVVGDITHLPFKRGTFRTCVSAETLEHVTLHQVAVEEFCRVLAGGGSLIVSVPAHERQRSEWDEWAGHIRRYEEEELLHLFQGFVPVALVGYGFPFLSLYDRLFLRRFITKRYTRGDSHPGVTRWVFLKRLLYPLLLLLFHLQIPSKRFNVGWLVHVVKPVSNRGDESYKRG